MRAMEYYDWLITITQLLAVGVEKVDSYIEMLTHL